MRKIVLQYAGLGALLAALLPGLPVQAQLWVASSGSGTSCSRSAPCNSLSVAVNLAIPGMEIRCADSTQFGDVIISKSITIDCAGTNSVIMPTFGIVIDAPGIVVTLRGLNIMGLGSNVGIDFVNGRELHVENCRIFGFNLQPATGIRFVASSGAPSKLFVSDTVIENNGEPSRGGGILILASTGGEARIAATRVTLNRVQLVNNTHGVVVDGTGGTGSLVVQVRDSVVTGSTGNGIWALSQSGAASAGIVVDHTSSVNNAGGGIVSQGSGALIHLGRSTIVGNGTGLNAQGGQIMSYRDNRATGNTVDGVPTGVLALK